MVVVALFIKRGESLFRQLTKQKKRWCSPVASARQRIALKSVSLSGSATRCCEAAVGEVEAEL
jgi:hypothetical protein